MHFADKKWLINFTKPIKFEELFSINAGYLFGCIVVGTTDNAANSPWSNGNTVQLQLYWCTILVCFIIIADRCVICRLLPASEYVSLYTVQCTTLYNVYIQWVYNAYMNLAFHKLYHIPNMVNYTVLSLIITAQYAYSLVYLPFLKNSFIFKQNSSVDDLRDFVLCVLWQCFLCYSVVCLYQVPKNSWLSSTINICNAYTVYTNNETKSGVMTSVYVICMLSVYDIFFYLSVSPARKNPQCD